MLRFVTRLLSAGASGTTPEQAMGMLVTTYTSLQDRGDGRRIAAFFHVECMAKLTDCYPALRSRASILMMIIVFCHLMAQTAVRGATPSATSLILAAGLKHRRDGLERPCVAWFRIELFGPFPGPLLLSVAGTSRTSFRTKPRAPGRVVGIARREIRRAGAEWH